MAFSSPEELHLEKLPDVPACMILDVRMRGYNGLDFHERVAKIKPDLPVIFISGHSDIPMTVRAVKGGAVDFIEKPIDNQRLLDSVNAALNEAALRRNARIEGTALRTKFNALSEIEREVLKFVAQGLLNKQIAAKLDLSEASVKVHRGRMMRKMGVQTLAELVKATATLGV